MDLTLPALLRRARATLQDPRTEARAIMAIDAAPGTRWAALALMAVVSALLTHASFALSPAETRDFFSEAMRSPLRTALLQGLAMALGVVLIQRLGALRGGHGRLPETISLMVWLQFIMLVLQAVQIVAQVLVPPLATMIGFAGVGIFFWLLTHFVAELHGFRALGPTFLGILGAILVLGFVLAFVVAAIVGPMPLPGA